MDKPHPIQPLVTDDNGILKFKANKIVRYLLDNGVIGLNDIARINFPREDREQFAQLIGYSLSGASDLSYFSSETITTAYLMSKNPLSEDASRIIHLRGELEAARDLLRAGVARLYGIAEEDLKGTP